MQLVLHAGLHHTDEDRLLKCLLRNREGFQARGVAVPGPSRYRRLIRDTLHAMTSGPLVPDARLLLLDAILEEDHAERVFLSNDNFFCVPKLALGDGRFYPKAEQRLAQFCKLFAEDTVELFLAIRNPASFLPALHAGTPREAPDPAFAEEAALALRWHELIARLRDHAPGVAISVWCNEDTPLIWAQLIREMAGLDHDEKIVGGFDLLSEIMSPEGMKRFRAYLKEHPRLNEIQKRRVISAFLDKYALEDEIEEVIDLPGWTEETIAALTDLYDEDVYQISRLPGVTLLAP